MMHPTNRAEREYLKIKKIEKKAKLKDKAGHLWRRRKVEAAKIEETDNELQETLTTRHVPRIS